MARKSGAEVVKEVTEEVNAAIAKNQHSEHLVRAVLVLLFLVGLGLLIFGAAVQRWELLVPGGLVQLTVYFPIRRLIELRGENVRLQILPALMRLAETSEAKKLAAALVQRLISQVGKDD